MASTSVFNRMVRAAQLQPALYEEVEADTGATPQALVVVVVASVAAGVGSGFDALASGGVGDFFYALMFGLASALAGWLLWALFSYVFGVSILKGPHTSSTWGELLRTMGFAQSPSTLRVFGFLPGVGGIIMLVASLWSLLATIIAVRQALDFSTWRAVLTAAVGWVAYMIVMLLVQGFLSSGATIAL